MAWGKVLRRMRVGWPRGSLKAWRSEDWCGLVVGLAVGDGVGQLKGLVWGSWWAWSWPGWGVLRGTADGTICWKGGRKKRWKWSLGEEKGSQLQCRWLSDGLVVRQMVVPWWHGDGAGVGDRGRRNLP